MPNYEYENAIAANGFKAICGVDEAGRGPLSGPVCAAAVILPQGLYLEGLNDSKKLTEKKREILFEQIKENALAYSISFASVEEIDELNILNATMLAMKRAVEGLSLSADFALIDGNRLPSLSIPANYLIKGDALSCSVAAASILAKVTRDRLCAEHDAAYPVYGFAKHKGYGTKAHMDAIREHGPCPLHRRTFLKFLDNE